MAQRSLKEKQREERERLILQAAEEILLEKGYYDTSMDEIAARVGIAKGTLYLHFAKKEDLMFTFLERELQSLLHAVEETSKMEGSAQEKLEAVVRGMFAGMSAKRAQLMFILHNGIDFRVVLKEHPETILRKISQQVAELLEEGKRNGEFDASMPTPVMLSTFFNVLSPRGFRSLLVDKKMPPEEVLVHVGRLYFRGIGSTVPFQPYIRA